MVKRNQRVITIVIVLVLLAANFFSPFKPGKLSVHLAGEPLLQVGGWTITNTLFSSWVVSLFLLIVALLTIRRLVDAPRAFSVQNIVEFAVEMLQIFVGSILGSRAPTFFAFVATLFLFILFSNLLVFIPGVGSVGLWHQEGGQRIFAPLFRSATGDLNTTAALAIIAVATVQVSGIRALGWWGYLSRFIAIDRFIAFFRAKIKRQKVPASQLAWGFMDLFFGLLELMGELTRLLSFSFRLFGNVFGGEVLLAVIATLSPYVMTVPFMILELLGSFLQAYIFAMLTLIFISRAVISHHHQQVPAAAGTMPTAAIVANHP